MRLILSDPSFSPARERVTRRETDGESSKIDLLPPLSLPVPFSLPLCTYVCALGIRGGE